MIPLRCTFVVNGAADRHGREEDNQILNEVLAFGRRHEWDAKKADLWKEEEGKERSRDAEKEQEKSGGTFSHCRASRRALSRWTSA